MHAVWSASVGLVGLDDAGTVARLRRAAAQLIDPTVIGNGGVIRQTAETRCLPYSTASRAGSGRDGDRAWVVASTGCATRPPYCFRIGINLVDAILDGADMHGDGVNIAVRLEVGLPARRYMCPRTMRDHARDRPGVRFGQLGAPNLKNIARPIEAFVLHFDESPATGIVPVASPVRRCRAAPSAGSASPRPRRSPPS